MSTFERRIEILRLLRLRKFEKIGNLAFQFSVSEKTIRRDICALSLIANIYTKQGSYYGGVYYLDETNLSIKEKISLLRKLERYCTPEEQSTLSKIIKDYGA